jgi:hypothetical protein
MAGEMIAMLHGLGGGRRYGLGDVVANADAAFAEMDAALATAQNATAAIDPTMGVQSARYAVRTFGGGGAGVSVQRNLPFFNRITGKFEARSYTTGTQGGGAGAGGGAATTGGGFQQEYKAPSSLGTDWTVYALPAGILLAAVGVAWYMTREKAL